MHALKEALLQVPAFANPQPHKSFVLELATIVQGIGALLCQDSGVGRKPVVFASRVLIEVKMDLVHVKRRYCLCSGLCNVGST